MAKVIVIFRKDRNECFALFPELPADNQGIYCTCYQHLGQHCAADYHGCVSRSDPAAPADYADLLQELKRRGYRLSVRQRATADTHERRRRLAAKWNATWLKIPASLASHRFFPRRVKK
jgi:hypothetical protein